MAKNSLQFVDLVRDDGRPASGLVPVRNAEATNLSIDEQAAVFEAAALEHVDFVFFRRFSDRRSSQISAYIVDNFDQRLDERQLAKLHQQVWLHGAAPLLYVAWPSRIDVLTCARGPDFWKDKNKEFAIQSQTINRYSGEIIETTTQNIGIEDVFEFQKISVTSKNNKICLI